MERLFSQLTSKLFDAVDHPFINYWLPETFREEAEGTEELRARALIVFAFLMSLFIIPYFCFFLFVQYQPSTLVWLSFALVPLILGPLVVKWTGRIDVATHLLCLTSLLITAGNAYSAGGPLDAGLPWLLLAPAYAVIFADVAGAVFWSTGAVLAAVFLYATAGQLPAGLGSDEVEQLQLRFMASSIGLVLFVTCLFVFQELLNESLLQRLRRVREKLRKQAIYDDLTGLPNRALFRDRLQHSIQRSRRRGHPMVVGFLDVDNFKEVNDNFGHEVGDRILVEVANRIDAMIRDEDTVARVGGDEFIFIFERARTREDVGTIGERLGESLESPVVVEGETVEVEASMGFARFEPDQVPEIEDERVAELLKRSADRAMYEAKGSVDKQWTLSSIEDLESSYRAGNGVDS